MTPLNTRRGVLKRLLWYFLEPTHDVILRTKPITTSDLVVESEMDTDSDRDGETGNNTSSFSSKDHTGGQQKDLLPQDMSPGERWLRHNYYFVAEKRWATFGAIEVIGGTLANILEGIPLTTTSVWMCIARPACILAIMLGTFILLIWKVPMAVRIQQWCAVVVIGGMLVASVIVTWNSITPSEDLELVAGYVGSFVMGATMILSIVEIVVMILTYIPSIRSLLSLPIHTLDSVIKHSDVVHQREEAKMIAAVQDSDNDDMQELAAPLIVEVEEERPIQRPPRRAPLIAFSYHDPLGTPPPTDEDEPEIEPYEQEEVTRVEHRVDQFEEMKRAKWEAEAEARYQLL